MTTAMVGSAQAQLRLPVAPLPALPIQKLTQTVGQAGADSLEQLSDVLQIFTAHTYCNETTFEALIGKEA